MLNKLTLSKTTVAIVVIALLWIIQDISTRFITNDKDQTAQSVGIIKNDLLLPMVSELTLQKIKGIYLPYQKSEQEQQQVVNTGMSEQEQLKQSGELENVFIGNHKLSLKAVLSKETEQTHKKTVLIQVTEIDTGEASVTTFLNNSTIYGYNLKVLSNTQVELTKENNGQQQTIILIMFKPRT